MENKTAVSWSKSSQLWAYDDIPGILGHVCLPTMDWNSPDAKGDEIIQAACERLAAAGFIVEPIVCAWHGMQVRLLPADERRFADFIIQLRWSSERQEELRHSLGFACPFCDATISTQEKAAGACAKCQASEAAALAEAAAAYPTLEQAVAAELARAPFCQADRTPAIDALAQQAGEAAADAAAAREFPYLDPEDDDEGDYGLLRDYVEQLFHEARIEGPLSLPLRALYLQAVRAGAVQICAGNDPDGEPVLAGVCDVCHEVVEAETLVAGICPACFENIDRRER